jgi:glycosyltransferase involved in cell wall biosynthesis
MEQMIGISVIVCCYNSRTRIAETLTYIGMQELKKNVNLEIILVDNASTDDTSIEAQKTWRMLGAPFELKIVTENMRGLIWARKAGLNAASFEYIVFCDDDNHLDRSYCQVAIDILDRRTQVGAAGGISIGKCAGQFPDWFQEFQGGYAVGRQAENSGIVKRRYYLWGAGLVTRRSLMMRIFIEKFALTGRSGDSMTSGDDSEICARVLLSNRFLYHFIPEERLTLAYRDKLFSSLHQADSFLSGYRFILKINSLNTFAVLFRLTKTAIKGFMAIQSTGYKKDVFADFFDCLAVITRRPYLTHDQVLRNALRLQSHYQRKRAIEHEART